MMADECLISTISLDPTRLSRSQTTSDKEAERLKEACSELESLFVYYLLKEMRKSIPKSGLFGGGKTEEMYTSMLDLELSREISSKREIGIAAVLYKQFANRQGPDEGKDENNPEE